jgi:hypothetical protein
MTVRPVLTESAATARATSSATAPLSRSAKERRERIFLWETDIAPTVPTDGGNQGTADRRFRQALAARCL